MTKQQIDLFPSCSEMVFRIGEGLEETRKQMYNIVKWIKKEYSGEAGDGDKEELSPQIKKQIAEVKQKIKEAKSLADFEKIVIEFTCNYETFFKVDGESLLVATCNNYNWDDVDKQDISGDSSDYWATAGVTPYELHDIIDGHFIFKLKYDDEDHDKFPMFIFAEKGQIFYDEDERTENGELKAIKKGSDTKFVIRDKVMYRMEDNHLIKVEEVKDKVLLNKIKILANLEDRNEKK
jgi:hypothetical protein